MSNPLMEKMLDLPEEERAGGNGRLSFSPPASLFYRTSQPHDPKLTQKVTYRDIIGQKKVPARSCCNSQPIEF